MGKTLDLVNKQFGEWTVIKYAGIKNKNSYWTCQCSCGTIKDVRGQILKNGQSTSCGHDRKADLIGQRFGRLLVVDKEVVPYVTGTYILWICQCDCGNISKVRTYDLKNRITQSCGCHRKEQVSKSCSKHIVPGTQFGEITVLSEIEERGHGGSIQYLVQCSCGKEYVITGARLRSGVISCGHCSSKGEYKILNFLKSNNIDFIPQWNNDKFVLSSGRLCRFDFAIMKDNNVAFLLEYNGQQHYSYGKTGWNTEENFQKTQKRDAEKATLCKKNGYPLEIITYSDFENIPSILTQLLQKYNIIPEHGRD